MTMTLTYRTLVLLAAGGSLALMLGAWGFQYLGDMAPCKLCYWQRYPHYAAIGIGALALLVDGGLLAWFGAFAAFTTAGIAAYHSGVEQGWWLGPTSCSSGDISDLSTEDLFDQIMAAPLIRCDDIPWQMFGLSMASWNMLASLALAVIWIMAARRT